MLNLIQNGIDYLNQNIPLRSIVIVIAFFLITKLLLFFIEKVVLYFTRKTKTEIDDQIVEASKNPVLILVMFFGFYLALKPFLGGNAIAKIAFKILSSGWIFVITLLVNRIFNILVDAWAAKKFKITKLNIKTDLLPLIHKVLGATLYIIATVSILAVWGIDLAPILASLGIAGIIIGMAVKDSLANLFSGVSLILDNVYKVGDIVSLESGQSGTIHEIGLRSTKIKSWDNEIYIIPNGKIANSVIKNTKQPNLAIKINLTFGVEYGSDPRQVKEIVTKAIESIDTLSAKDDRGVTVRLMEFGASSLDFKAMFWVDDLSNKWSTREEALNRIYAALNKHKIGIPYPTTTVVMGDKMKKPKMAQTKKVAVKGQKSKKYVEEN